MFGQELQPSLTTRGRRGCAQDENPAQWKGNLKVTMAVQAKTGGHHAALPWKEMQTFRDALAKQKGVAARAVEMAIYTAARSGEVRGMTWAEVDMEADIWTVPAGRMKMDREHRVSLSAVARAILMERATIGQEGLVFPGMRPGIALSDMSLTAVLRRMQPEAAAPRWADSVSGRAITAHGFRATFRTWAAEATTFHEAIAEAALSHVEGNKIVAAYSRGDMFDKRIKLMAAWADFVTGM